LVYVTFTCKEMCPLITLNGLRIPQVEDTQYLRLYLALDRKLNRKNIFTKRKQFSIEISIEKNVLTT